MKNYHVQDKYKRENQTIYVAFVDVFVCEVWRNCMCCVVSCVGLSQLVGRPFEIVMHILETQRVDCRDKGTNRYIDIERKCARDPYLERYNYYFYGSMKLYV